MLSESIGQLFVTMVVVITTNPHDHTEPAPHLL